MWILDDRPGFKATGMFNDLSFLRARIAVDLTASRFRQNSETTLAH
jgi:hypothetical protein